MEHNLESIKKEFFKIAEKIHAPKKYVHFYESARQDGSPHVEFAHGLFYRVVTERGEELERIPTPDPEKLLYWLAADLTFPIALDYELANRVKDQDSRRIWFQKQIDLLTEINPNWGEIKREELQHHLFNDKKEPRYL